MIYRELKKLIKLNGIIVEIGAHIGTDTIKLYRQLKPARHFAIEPVDDNVQKLIKLIVKNRLNIDVVPSAIGNVDGYVPFYFSDGHAPGNKRRHTDSSSLMKPGNNLKQRPWMRFEKGMIFCQRLDTFYRQNLGDAIIDLIWMDVQGAELLVIAGGQKALAKTRYLYTECQEERYQGQPGLEKIRRVLPGWKIVLMNGDNVLLENKGQR